MVDKFVAGAVPVGVRTPDGSGIAGHVTFADVSEALAAKVQSHHDASAAAAAAGAGAPEPAPLDPGRVVPAPARAGES